MSIDNTEQVRSHWFIDLDWYQQNDCSFSVVAQSRLCPKCYERLKVGEGEISADELLTAFKDCCSKTQDFITGRLPILESIFRLFLANGNQPLNLNDLGKQLSERRGGDSYRTSAEVLSHLLDNDQCYGLRQAPV